jgi:hypothetical protein
MLPTKFQFIWVSEKIKMWKIVSTVRNFIIYSYFTQQNKYVANYPYLFYFVQNKMTNQLVVR